MKCPWCDGTGKRRKHFFKKADYWPDAELDRVEQIDCPHCEDGTITLAVEEKCQLMLSNGCYGVGCRPLECIDEKITRPLTDEEVMNGLFFTQTHYAGQVPLAGSALLNSMKHLGLPRDLTYNGLRVVIMKGE